MNNIYYIIQYLLNKMGIGPNPLSPKNQKKKIIRYLNKIKFKK